MQHGNLKSNIIDENKIDDTRTGSTYNLIAVWEETNHEEAIYYITLNKDGGNGGADYIYIKNNVVYTDISCTNELTGDKTIEIPSKEGFKFVGYFIGADDAKVISSLGKIVNDNLSRLTELNGNATVKAKYNPVYTVKFDFNGGENGTQKVYMSYVSAIKTEPSETSKGLRMYSDYACTTEISGQKIVVPERTGYKFLGYKINNGVTNQEYSFDGEGNLLDIATR